MEISSYEVYPYGYETLLPALRMRFRKRQSALRSPSEERLRSTPDLLVFDPNAEGDDASTQLVEVKFRNWGSPKDVRLNGIRWYQRYWPDAIRVLIIPGGDLFYAQRVDQLNADQRNFNLTKEFAPLSKLFKKVRPKIMTLFQEDVKSFCQAGL